MRSFYRDTQSTSHGRTFALPWTTGIPVSLSTFPVSFSLLLQGAAWLILIVFVFGREVWAVWHGKRSVKSARIRSALGMSRGTFPYRCPLANLDIARCSRRRPWRPMGWDVCQLRGYVDYLCWPVGFQPDRFVFLASTQRLARGYVVARFALRGPSCWARAVELLASSFCGSCKQSFDFWWM